MFTTSGQLVVRVLRGAHLHAPWGLALAPSDFGPFSNALLVGNFGNGHIQALDPTTGHFLGELQDDNGRPIVIDGLWGMTFGTASRPAIATPCTLLPDLTTRRTDGSGLCGSSTAVHVQRSANSSLHAKKGP